MPKWTDLNENKEIEARFLVCGDEWRGKGDTEEILQGYLSTDKERVVRIRLKGGKAILTIKGKTEGLVKKEYEFELDDVDKAKNVILNLCKYPIEKTRHKIKVGEFLWELDEFKGINKGLVMAEIEFKQERDYKKMVMEGKPEWIGKEITEGHWQYTNMRLAERPFTTWTDEEKSDMLKHAAIISKESGY